MKQREYDFVITLKHPDYKIYNLISVLLCVITTTAAIYALLQSWFYSYMWLNVLLIAVVVTSLIIALFNLNKKESITTFKWALYASAFLWLLNPLHQPFIGIVFIIAALLERQVKFPQEIGFRKEGITFNTFPFKNYTWQQVKNVVLKDDIITLDFVNNKIIQRELEPAELTEEEDEFNEFCKLQIRNSR
ncbi:MAG: hypothetical protein JO072_11815 [Parafilimonas sp.]|nr:hypothetical protein [Parafilimonas sp.]